jgi:hypothetical protein
MKNRQNRNESVLIFRSGSGERRYREKSAPGFRKVFTSPEALAVWILRRNLEQLRTTAQK